MDIGKIIETASRLGLLDVVRGVGALVADVREAAIRAPHLLAAADRAELDQVHREALAAADRLDQALAAAERR